MSKNLSAKYYQENKERLHKKASEIRQNLSKEERYKNLSENEKNKLIEYRRKYYRTRKST